jgi:hypothetical protein
MFAMAAGRRITNPLHGREYEETTQFVDHTNGIAPIASANGHEPTEAPGQAVNPQVPAEPISNRT